MIGQYGPLEAVRNAWALLLTKLFFPKARLVRRPFYLRGGKKRFCYGPGFTCGYSCRIELAGEGPSLIMGVNCKINDRVHISAHERIVIGDNVLMGSNILITDNSHGAYEGASDDPGVHPDDRPIVTKPVVIGNDVWIGEFVSILPGVTIGDGAVIGSNTVVTRDVESNTVVVGVPGKAIKRWDASDREWKRVV